MAKRHRKLFPLLSEINQTEDCSLGLCDQVACPYNCYYYTSPPPPSSPLPLPPSISPVDSQENHNNHLSTNVIIIITVVSVFSFFLLVSIYFAAKFSSIRRNRNNRGQDQSNGRDGEEFLDENQVDHPIWYIRTIGLQQSVINSITITRYRRDEGLIEGTECSVCLNEFQEYETLRLLPKCNHAFHISCIDTWLRSHTNCPLCRAHILTNSIPSDPARIEVNSDGSSTQMEDSDDNDENEERNFGQSENRAETDGEGEERISKEAVDSNIESYHNLASNMDMQMERLNFSGESHQNQERSAGQIENSYEPERDCEHGSIEEAMNSNDHNYLNCSPNTITQMEKFDRFGESDYNQERRSCDQSPNRFERGINDEIHEATVDNVFEPVRGRDSMYFNEAEGSSNDREANDTGDSRSSISSNRLEPAENSSVSLFLHRGPVSMKRSASCSGRIQRKTKRFFH